MLHIYLSPTHDVIDSSEQAVHYNIVGIKLRGFISDMALRYLQVKMVQIVSL
jgi:hypothetical protein